MDFIKEKNYWNRIREELEEDKIIENIEDEDEDEYMDEYFLKKKIYRIKLIGAYYNTFHSNKIYHKRSIIGWDLTFIENYFFTRIVRVSSHFNTPKSLYYERMEVNNFFSKKKEFYNSKGYLSGMLNSLYVNNVFCNNINFGSKFYEIGKSLDMFISNDQYLEYNIRYDSKLYLYKAEECRLSFISNRHLDMVKFHIDVRNTENFLGKEVEQLYFNFFENEIDIYNSKIIENFIKNSTLKRVVSLYVRLGEDVLDKFSKLKKEIILNSFESKKKKKELSILVNRTHNADFYKSLVFSKKVIGNIVLYLNYLIDSKFRSRFLLCLGLILMERSYHSEKQYKKKNKKYEKKKKKRRNRRF